MTRIKFSNNGNTPFERLIGHNIDFLKRWNDLEETLWKKTLLDPDLLEQVRRTMAFGNGCEYCMVKGGKPDFEESQMKISTAASFAELFCIDHRSISDAHFEMLREYYTDEEISELCVFIAFLNASQKLGKTMNLTEDLQAEAIVKLKDIE
ncbi:carboxymuconolactone decarboxylase family protein [Chryseobacterium arthrosphaerae]|uniref:carboxymuconolactone decarboxylase family protein n=1 Tax=Chryseobacterium TaxID=59732 RepID=UPI0023E33239|nr:carboxymuconolactone decarboxylase family protein [Chryseobacterium arthrosphaerae]WES98194.1 carboxymuconolactone decarboxylase family protein [Chryseobacterium arthrosphaerae]